MRPCPPSRRSCVTPRKAETDFEKVPQSEKSPDESRTFQNLTTVFFLLLDSQSTVNCSYWMYWTGESCDLQSFIWKITLNPNLNRAKQVCIFLCQSSSLCLLFSTLPAIGCVNVYIYAYANGICSVNFFMKSIFQQFLKTLCICLSYLFRKQSDSLESMFVINKIEASFKCFGQEFQAFVVLNCQSGVTLHFILCSSDTEDIRVVLFTKFRSWITSSALKFVQ